jgi:hypothetical protein
MKSFGASSLKLFSFFAQVWLASLNNDITETNISHCKELLTPTVATTFGWAQPVSKAEADDRASTLLQQIYI